MPAIRYPTRYRRMPHGPAEFAAFRSECAALLARAGELDNAQQALGAQLAEVRTQLAEMRIVMWPRVDPKDIVHGFRRTRRGGPPPIPPVAPGAHPLVGKHLRSTVLAVLARNARPMTLVEIHRELHLNGFAIASRQPVKRLADALGYETRKGRARRLDRGIYVLDLLNPGDGAGSRASPSRPRLYSPRTTSAISSPAAVGFVATRTPAASSASIFACAVPFEPETIAPACPIFLPGGAVTPAM